MGVFSRPDSPFWWLWLDGAAKPREKTRFLIGQTKEEKKASLADAEALYHKRMLELGRQIHGLAPAPVTAISFLKYAAWYDTHVIAHHRGAVREREILHTLKAHFGRAPLSAITRDGTLTWRSTRARQTSASTSNRELALLKRMLALAVPQYLPASPLAGLPMLRTVKRETAVLSREDEDRLLEELGRADQALVIAALDTLMRLSDLLNLRREQDRQTYLVVVDPKTRPYKVPVSSRLRAALDRLPKDGPYYFAHRRHKDPVIARSMIKNLLTRACKAADIPYGRAVGGLTFHGLRHTGATRMVEAGVPLRIIQEIGGWKSLKQLERYTHPTERAKRDAVESIGRDDT